MVQCASWAALLACISIVGISFHGKFLLFLFTLTSIIIGQASKLASRWASRWASRRVGKQVAGGQVSGGQTGSGTPYRPSYVPLYVHTVCICPSSVRFVTDSGYATLNEKSAGMASQCEKGHCGIVGDQCVQAGR